VPAIAAADLAMLTAQDLAAAYRDGMLSPVDVVTDTLRRIDQVEPAINAFTFVNRESALSEAQASEARWRAGRPKSPFDGVLCTIKSNIATIGWPMRRGATTAPDQPMAFNAPATERLIAAGCIPIGQTTMPQYGWIGVCHSSLTGVTRNPWNRALTPGGSSGGAAAAAALNLGHFHLGTDGAGSIRIPASFTGVVGLKPSLGRVPAFPASPFGVLAKLGPLTRTVADAAAMQMIVSRPDPRDLHAIPTDPPDLLPPLTQGIRGLRIAFSATLGWVEGLDGEIAAAVEAAARRLTEFGAIVTTEDPGFTRDQARDPLIALWNAGCAAVVEAVPADRHHEIEPGLMVCAQEGKAATGLALVRALMGRAGLYETMRQFHSRHDLLITPTMPIAAFAAGEDMPPAGGFGDQWFDWSPYTWPFNVTGQPAASVPVGLTADGRPIGLQIIGPLHREDLVLRVARAIEMLAPMERLQGVRG
jgi:aspartyl-tRNA(Asn)/glutamyl-tRNA(Gln) amidotransferase subunit A